MTGFGEILLQKAFPSCIALFAFTKISIHLFLSLGRGMTIAEYLNPFLAFKLFFFKYNLAEDGFSNKLKKICNTSLKLLYK